MSIMRNFNALREAYSNARDEYLAATNELQCSTVQQDAAWDSMQADEALMNDTHCRRFIEARRRWIIANKTHDVKRRALDNAIRDLVDGQARPIITPRLSDYGVF